MRRPEPTRIDPRTTRRIRRHARPRGTFAGASCANLLGETLEVESEVAAVAFNACAAIDEYILGKKDITIEDAGVWYFAPRGVTFSQRRRCRSLVSKWMHALTKSVLTPGACLRCPGSKAARAGASSPSSSCPHASTGHDAQTRFARFTSRISCATRESAVGAVVTMRGRSLRLARGRGCGVRGSRAAGCGRRCPPGLTRRNRCGPGAGR